MVLGLFATVPFILAAQRSIASVSTEATGTGFTKFRNEPVLLKLEKDFWKTHEDVDNIDRYEDKNGYFIYYTKNGNRGKSFYNKKGRFVYDVITYPGKQLSPRVADWVKSFYYHDYDIINVKEIRTGGEVYMFVQISDGKNWNNLRIHDGEMELVQHFTITPIPGQ